MNPSLSFRIFAVFCWALAAPAHAQANKAAAAAAEHALSPVAKEAAERAAKEMFEQAAKDAAKTAAEQSAKGVETQLAKAAGEYGERVITLARRVPEAAEALASRSAQLVPLTEKLGDDVLRMEARAPGFGELAAKSFGKKDLPRLLRLTDHEMKSVVVLSGHATEPRAAKLLLEGAEKGGQNFLSKISSKQIVAAGLSVAAVLAAYRMAGIVESSPGAFLDAARHFGETLLSPFAYVGAALLAAWGGLAAWRRHARVQAAARI